MQHNYTYESALAASSRINWKVEDIIDGEKKLDFTKPFLPESLAQVNELSFLSAAEKKTLNQIRGHEYLSMFGLVEEFILPYGWITRDRSSPEMITGSGPCSDLPARKPSTFTSSNASAKNSRRVSATSVISLAPRMM